MRYIGVSNQWILTSWDIQADIYRNKAADLNIDFRGLAFFKGHI